MPGDFEQPPLKIARRAIADQNKPHLDEDKEVLKAKLWQLTDGVIKTTVEQQQEQNEQTKVKRPRLQYSNSPDMVTDGTKRTNARMHLQM